MMHRNRISRYQRYECAPKGLVHVFLVLAAALILSACGGGGSTTPTTPADTRPVAVAGADVTVGTGTSVMLDGSGSADPSGASLVYRWSVVASPSGSTAQFSDAGLARPIFTPDKSGTYTLSLVVSNGQMTSSPSTLTIISTNASLPTIAIDQSQPVSGSVGLSLSGTVAGAVTWYADQRLLGNGSGAAATYNWDTATTPNGDHLILARIQITANTFQEIRRTVTVGESPITLTASSREDSGTVTVDVNASSTNGMSSVTASFDGGPTVTLNAPNACLRICSVFDLWRFQFPGATAGSHSVIITATDRSSVSRTLTVSIAVFADPQLVLTNPSDGQLVNGRLNFAGFATIATTGPITVTAQLGSLAIPVSASATAGGVSFSGSYDLTGVTPGSYTLTVTANYPNNNVGLTASRSVFITSSSALTYTPVFTIPGGASSIALDGSHLLYRTSDGRYVLRNLDSSTEVTLQSTATLQYASDWQVTLGRTVVTAKDDDCTTNWNCVYEWRLDGSRRNLTAASNLSTGYSYQDNPVSNGEYVVWTNWGGPSGSYTLYNVVTESFMLIPKPFDANGVGNNSYGLAPNNGNPVFYYWGQTGGSGTASSYDIFSWTGGISTRVTSDGLRNVYVQTDGVRAAWQSSPVGGYADGTFALKTVPVGGTTVSTVATGASSFKLADGVLAWVESTSTARRLKASTSLGPVATLSNMLSANLHAVGAGRVAYSQAGQLYSWDSTTNASTLRLEMVPSNVWISSGKLIFIVGASVYRVPL